MQPPLISIIIPTFNEERNVVRAYNAVQEAFNEMSGKYQFEIIFTLASNQIGIPYLRQERQFGKSKFPLRRLIPLAIDGIVSHSTTPLRIASIAGFIISTITMLMAGGYIVGWYFFGMSWPVGFTTEIILLLFGISLNAIFLGIIGEYVGRIYQQIRQRPLTVVETTLNLNSNHEPKIFKSV